MKKTINVYNLIHWLFVFFLVLNGNSVYNSGERDYHINIICCILGLLLLSFGAKKVQRKSFRILWLYVVYQIPIIIVAFAQGDYAYTYIFKYVFFIEIIFIAMSQNEKFLTDTIKIYTKLLFIICIISLFFYLSASILNLIQPTGIYVLTWDGTHNINNYFGIYFEAGHAHILEWKNQAIFTEAPIFAAWTSLALAFELFCNQEKIQWKYLLVFYLTLLTTLSTTAFIFIALSVAGLVYTNWRSIGNNNILKMVVGILAVSIIIGALIISFLILQDKSTKGISYLTRSDDLIVGFKTLKDHPIFGVGFGNMESRAQYFSLERLKVNDDGQSSDFASLLGAGGLYFMLIYMSGIIGILKECTEKHDKLVLFGMILFLVVVSRIGSVMLFLLFVFGGLYRMIIHDKVNFFGIMDIENI